MNDHRTQLGRGCSAGQGRDRMGGVRRRGFTLIELLVVMAISVILLGLIFGPILSSFNFLARGRITADAQESGRRALEMISREAKDAVQVAVSSGDVIKLPQAPDALERTVGVRSEGFIYGYNDLGEKYHMANAMIDLVPADDTLGLHGGSLVSPLVPQVTDVNHAHEAGGGKTQAATGQHNIIIRYFIGLLDPGYPHSNPNDPYSARNGDPVWSNTNLSQNVLSGPDVDNTYVLYRIEFDTEDPAFNNWELTDPDSPLTAPRLIINPDFFYDNRPSPTGEPYWVNWKRNAQIVSEVRNVDLMRLNWTDKNNNGVRDKLETDDMNATVTFSPTVVQNDTAQPTTDQSGAPVTYVASHGNWTGVQNSGGLTATGFNPPAIGFYPHIVVYQPVQNCSDSMVRVYDNWVTQPTNSSDPCNPDPYPDHSRVLTWDSRSGVVRFRAGVDDTTNTGSVKEVALNDIIPTGTAPNPTDPRWEFDLFDLAQRNSAMTLPPSLRRYARIIPGSETLQVTYNAPVIGPDGSPDYTLPPVSRTDTYRHNPGDAVSVRTGSPPDWWNPTTMGPYPPTLPPPGTYNFDTETGTLMLGFPSPGPYNPQSSQPIPTVFGPAGQITTDARLSVRFTYQTNSPDDIVRVDYATKSLLNVAMGMRMFDPSTGRPILAQLSDKVALRNIGR